MTASEIMSRTLAGRPEGIEKPSAAACAKAWWRACRPPFLITAAIPVALAMAFVYRVNGGLTAAMWRAWVANRPVQIRSPHATRPWQLVLEPLSGYLWLGALLLMGPEKAQRPFPLSGEAYNFGPAADVNNSVAEVVKALSVYWPGFTSEMDLNGQAGRKECTLLKLCCDKSLAYLGWKATLTFDETIRYTAEWYSRYYCGGGKESSMLDFTLGQIRAYAEAAEGRGQIWVK